jgi:hypothetical protein
VAGNQGGIVTVGGNYIAAFADNFWDFAQSATVGYGSPSSSIDWSMTFYEDLGYRHVVGDFFTRLSSADSTEYMGSDVLVYEFPSGWPNPDGGKRPAHLTSIVLKEGVGQEQFLAEVWRPEPSANISVASAAAGLCECFGLCAWFGEACEQCAVCAIVTAVCEARAAIDNECVKFGGKGVKAVGGQ